MFELLGCHIWNLTKCLNKYFKKRLFEGKHNSHLSFSLMGPLAHDKEWTKIVSSPNIFTCVLATWKGLNLDISNSLNITVKGVELKWEGTHLKNQVEFIKLTNLLHTFQETIVCYCFFVWIVLLTEKKVLFYAMMWTFCLKMSGKRKNKTQYLWLFK